MKPLLYFINYYNLRMNIFYYFLCVFFSPLAVFLKTTNKNGFNTRPVWQLLSQVPHLKKYPKMDLSNSINLSKAIVCLPSSVKL